MWTRSKCRRCQTHIPFVLQGKYKEAVSTKAGRSSSESSSSGECEDKVLAHQAPWAKERELRALREETRGSRKKEGHRRCSLLTLVKKARSQKRETWKRMKKLTARKNGSPKERPPQPSAIHPLNVCICGARVRSKKRGSRSCKILSKRRNDLVPEHQKMQKTQKLQSPPRQKKA